MAADGVGKIFVSKGHRNSEKYMNVLETALMPSFTRIFGDSNLYCTAFLFLFAGLKEIETNAHHLYLFTSKRRI